MFLFPGRLCYIYINTIFLNQKISNIEMYKFITFKTQNYFLICYRYTDMKFVYVSSSFPIFWETSHSKYVWYIVSISSLQKLHKSDCINVHL